MELRAGYQLTEVGVIPDEWKTASIIQVVQKIIDYRGRTPRKLGMGWGGGEIPALSARNVKMGFIDFDEECNFGSEALYEKWMTSGHAARDDIVFTTEAPLGNVALIPDAKRYILSQRTILLKTDSTYAYSPFLFQLMLSDGFQELLAENASGSTAQGIQRKKFETLQVACPPIQEQRAIATVLSDVDALIAGLERLIAKKRDIKQAAMQQLLTGQARLPGFSGEWASVQLGDVLDVCHGKNQHAVEVSDGPYPILATGGQIGTASQPLHDRPSVLIGRKGTINKPQYMDTPFWTVDTLFYCNVHHPNSARFLYYRFLLIDWMQYNEASGVPSLNGRTIERIEIECPDAKEQTAIATVLSDMDADISALESRLAKTRAIKQGMMQELLMGRTRLV